MNRQSILDSIAELPRIKLARLCTPLEETPQLRAAIAESMDGGYRSRAAESSSNEMTQPASLSVATKRGTWNSYSLT